MRGLMFGAGRVDWSGPSLHEAASAAFAGLAGSTAVIRHEHIEEEKLSLDQAAAIVRAWSLVHGFTMLLLDDRLSDILRRLADSHTGANEAVSVASASSGGLRTERSKPPCHPHDHGASQPSTP